MSLVPPIGTAGLYSLVSPFDTQIAPGVQYTCTAVRSLPELLASSINPQEEYYTPNALDDTVYRKDVSDNVCIVTLQSSRGVLLYVPSSYIKSYPDMSGVPYTGAAIIVNLGAVPDDMILDTLRAKLLSTVLDVAGIKASTRVIATTSTSLIPYETDKTIRNARNIAMSAGGTDYSKLLIAQETIATLMTKVAALEKHIVNGGGLVQQDGTIVVNG